ncbi:MAG: FAD-dependent oxidoreductase, partial [Clostridiales bacterium]|nr:FAD-dependent oxidoreductase [Clostridiales bacterium]
MKKMVWIKLAALLMSAAMLPALAGCAQTEQPKPEPSAAPQPGAEPEPEGMTPGVYTGTVNGYGGEMTVEVTVTEDAITDVKIGQNGETTGIGSNAIEQMPGRIVAAQSINLDTMTGCTISSAAILQATKNALDLAGGAGSEAFGEKPIGDTTPVEKTTDVVIAGGGMAGLSAAYTAAEAGASVILLEKAAQTGGATATSGGDILAGGSSVQAAQGIEDTVDSLKDFWWEAGEGQINRELMNSVAEE